MKRGVIYARYSCDKQTENSTKAQIRECTDWANKNNIEIINIYKDEAISGRTDRRPAFQQMISDAQRDMFDCIVVWKGDRFSRSRADAAKYKTMLKKLDIRVLSVTEPNIEGPQQILMDGINEAFAEYYSVELAAKIRRGQDQNMLDGKWNGGSVPFGYDHDPKTQKCSINEHDAEIVREVFRMYTQEFKSANAIAIELQNRGVLGKRGKIISKAGVYHMLTHEDYTGVYHWKQWALRDIFPRIIDDETFKKAQELLKKNARTRGKKKVAIEYFLSSRLYCGKCGAMMVGRSGRGGHNKKKYYYYSCKNFKNKGTCDLHDIPKELVESAVISLIRDRILLDPEKREFFIQEIIRHTNEENPEIPSMTKELEDTNKKLRNLLALLEEVDDIDEVKDRIKYLKEKRDGLKLQLQRAKSQAGTFDRDQLESFFNHLAKCPFTKPEDKRFLIKTFLYAAYVYDDGSMTVFLNYAGQVGTITGRPPVRMSFAEVHHFFILCCRSPNPSVPDGTVRIVLRQPKIRGSFGSLFSCLELADHLNHRAEDKGDLVPGADSGLLQRPGVPLL